MAVRRVYRTDEDGTIWVRSNGYEIVVELLSNVKKISKTISIEINFSELLLYYQKDDNNHLIAA